MTIIFIVLIAIIVLSLYIGTYNLLKLKEERNEQKKQKLKEKH